MHNHVMQRKRGGRKLFSALPPWDIVMYECQKKGTEGKVTEYILNKGLHLAPFA